MSSDTPGLSVILIIAGQRERARLSLKSLLRQSLIDQMEIIVVDCSQPGTPPIPGSDHPSVRIIRVAPRPLTGWVRAEAVRAARAPLVAFLEEHAWVFPGWAEGFVKAFEGPWAGVGVEMHVANGWAGINRYLGILNYPLLLAPAIIHPNIMVHHNAAHLRDILLAYGERLNELFFPEDWLQLQLLADGHRLITDPRVRIFHFFETNFVQSFNFNLIAGQVAEASCNRFYHRSRLRRMFRLGSLAFSPVVRPIKQFLFFAQARRAWLGTFFSGIVIITLLHTAHAIGGKAGVLFGMTDETSMAFLQRQINLPRAMLADAELEALE
jgi:glycosyltransferase involved in cell wall biosynthesis